MISEAQLAGLTAIVRGVSENKTMVPLGLVGRELASLTAIVSHLLTLTREGTAGQKAIAVPGLIMMIPTGRMAGRKTIVSQKGSLRQKTPPRIILVNLLRI